MLIVRLESDPPEESGIRIPDSLYGQSLREVFNQVANVHNGLMWLDGKKAGITLPTLKRATTLASDRGHDTLCRHLEVILAHAKDRETERWEVTNDDTISTGGKPDHKQRSGKGRKNPRQSPEGQWRLDIGRDDGS